MSNAEADKVVGDDYFTQWGNKLLLSTPKNNINISLISDLIIYSLMAVLTTSLLLPRHTERRGQALAKYIQNNKIY